jgi:hypothetical protein
MDGISSYIKNNCERNVEGLNMTEHQEASLSPNYFLERAVLPSNCIPQIRREQKDQKAVISRIKHYQAPRKPFLSSLMFLIR